MCRILNNNRYLHVLCCVFLQISVGLSTHILHTLKMWLFCSFFGKFVFVSLIYSIFPLQRQFQLYFIQKQNAFHWAERGSASAYRPPAISLAPVCTYPHLIGRSSACQVTWHAEKFTTLYTCGWYIRARGGILYTAKEGRDCVTWAQKSWWRSTCPLWFCL